MERNDGNLILFKINKTVKNLQGNLTDAEKLN